MSDVVMPRLSDSMEEGTIVGWLKNDGDHVDSGDALVEVETDKATMTYEADASGYLRIVVPAGEVARIGAVIARLLPEPVGASGLSSPSAPQAAPAIAVADAVVAVGAPSVATHGDGASPVRNNDGRAVASPLARRVAAEHGIDLQTLSGSGPNGRIIRADVERALDGPAPTAIQPAPALTPAAAKGESTVVAASRAQQVIARRMAESKATMPEFCLSTEIEMTGATALRRQLRDALESIGGPVPSYNDFIVKACATALRAFPQVNGSYKDGDFELYSRINVGIAVATPDSLVVPTVVDADRKSLGEIARESRRLAERVRSQEITPPEVSGGTFTISNLGMFGISEFVAVINPPQAAILAVGKIEERPVVRDGEIVSREIMKATLVADHRILYGAYAAQFLERVKHLLESPILLAT
jgi:pyruvate dehydrogenase E2 component (dihydrolipoamide acetyltransferase)